MRIGGVVLALVAVGCGPPSKLTALPNKQISLILDFNRPPPSSSTPPSVSAFLQYANDADVCPALSIAAALDDTMLTPDPTTSGSAGAVCLLGFVLSGMPPPDAPQSTLRFADVSGSVAYTLTRLLDPRGFATTATSVNAGDKVTLDWSVATDTLDTASATFVSGTTMQTATPTIAGTTATLTVPSLRSGSWMLQIAPLAHAAQVSCDVDTCSNAIGSTTTLPLTIN
ncbi:MAG TPA: hypothetical protein VGL86_04395 [Polyangia bacterium]|jgi:hypothetical protein